MRKTWTLALAFVAAVALAACGDKGGSGGGGGGGGGGGPAGAWTFDVDQIVKVGLDEAKKKLAEMPEEQRKMAEAMMNPEAMKSMMEGMFKNAKFELKLNADKTASMEASGLPGEEGGTGTGTWEQNGDKVVITPKTKDGKPITEEKDKKPLELLWKNGVLSIQSDGGPTMPLKRK